ncbi:nuclease-related domain-containing protein [Parafrankia elaeagni]|uniref:nuclease-related domain-containing protein n=1 Tax=Parafrankia elaeagni TaxID=222534 RepID=UPI00036EB359|nr:nuclease-related domain-containing protein [Parafrankia elaeagni]
MVRRDRISREVPRAAIRAAVVGLGLGLVLGFGLGMPGLGITVFVALLVIWPGGVAVGAFGASPDVETLREAAEAERKTARAIARLRRHGYSIMHDRAVPYSQVTIGHLLVGPGGVMILGSDTNKGVVRYSKGGAVVDGESLKPVIDKAAWLGGEVRNQVRAALPALTIPTFPILVMVEASVLWKDGAVDGVTVINVKDVVNYVRNRPGRLNPGQVQQVISAAQRLFPPFSSNRLAEHVVVDRDQWLTLMDALRGIRESGGDASGMLDRLAQIEADLARQADLIDRAGLPTSRSADTAGAAPPGAGVGVVHDLGDLADPAAPGIGAPAQGVPGSRPAGGLRGRILASVRPEQRGGNSIGPAGGRPYPEKRMLGSDQQAARSDGDSDGPMEPGSGR